jgi:DNA-directed RNA polymerase subunit alpha
MDLKKKGFQLPANISFDSDSLTDTYGKLSAEAFETGFGTTVGNALRRVLLSSIEGAAVTSIRIPGVLHEFSTLKGVKEDIVDAVLNVKQLRVKMHTDGPELVTVNVKGPSDVKGKDISGAQVEVLNPDQHIVSVEKGVDFKMELTVKKGKGYLTAEANKDEDQPVDTMAVDSIFTPVKKVNFWVEGARVGRSTDYDKLVMEIWTDGSVSPESAVTQAANILTEHLSLFALDGSAAEEVQETETEAVSNERDLGISEDFFDDEPVELSEHLLKSVEELELSVRSYNCLKNANIRTLAELVQKTVNEIKELIEMMGLHFNMRVDPDELQKLALMKRPENAS